MNPQENNRQTTSAQQDAAIMRAIISRIKEELAIVDDEIRCLRPLIQGEFDKADIKACLEKIKKLP